jgi:hypothetical protein
MPRLTLKTDTGGEPKDSRAWPGWMIERLREARAAGAEAPQFRQKSPWPFWELQRLVWSDDELRGCVHIEPLERRIEWCEPADHDDEL